MYYYKLYLPDDLRNRLKAKAAIEGKSIKDFLTELIVKELDK